MGRQRRVANLMAVAVLSTLLQRPMHPYEVAAVMRERGKDRDMKIKWGSLYTVVRNLERHGLLEAAASERSGARPRRTVYRLTEAGRAELEDWVRELISTPEREYPRFKAGLSVLSVLSPDEASRLLRERLGVLEREIAATRQALDDHRREVPRLFLVEAEYDLALREAEATWTRSLLKELSTGSFPGLAHWRGWHDTGRAPTAWTHDQDAQQRRRP